jgi:hypothetical protein
LSNAMLHADLLGPFSRPICHHFSKPEGPSSMMHANRQMHTSMLLVVLTLAASPVDGSDVRRVHNGTTGPGEVLRPRDMILMPDGSVGLVLEGLGLVKFVDAGGNPAGSLRLGAIEGGWYTLVSGAGIDNGLVLAGTRSTGGATRLIRNRRNFLVRSDLDGNEAAVFAPDGTLELVIEKDYAPLNRTKADREQFSHLIKTSLEGMPREMNVEQEDTYPAISSFHRGIQVTADGFLWVLSGRGMKPDAPEVMAINDVFDRAGVFVRQTALVAPHDIDQVGIVFAGKNRVIVIKGFLESLAFEFANGASFSGEEWSNPEVIVYEMKSL